MFQVHNFETGEIGMTAEAGQMRTKISIVNNTLKNDNSSQPGTKSVDLVVDTESTLSDGGASAYLASVPVPTEWRQTSTAPKSELSSTQTSKNKGTSRTALQWPTPASICTHPKATSTTL